MEAPSEWPMRIGFSTFRLVQQLGQSNECLVMHEAHRALLFLQDVRVAVAIAVVDQRAPAGRRGDLRREIAPLPDRAEAFVQEHQRRLAGLLADPFVGESNDRPRSR